jgi:hypothetical protein
MSTTPITKQVVVSAASLAPFYPILPDSDLIALRETTPQESDIIAVSPGVFTQIDKVVHLYPLQFIAQGTILEQGQFSRIPLSEDDLKDLPNRQIVALRVEKGAYSAAAIPPQRVTLIFSPKDSTSNQGSLSVNDVLILDVKPEADGAATFVFAATIDLAKVAPVLGNSAVFVIQPTGPS